MGLQCYSPIQLKRPEGLLQLVPCGHCLNCSIKRQTAWSLRILCEAQDHALNSFVTLTYSDDTRPNALEYGHISRSMKLLRRNFGRVRFFCVGEFGKQTNREHWHLILFGQQLPLGQQVIKQWPHGGCFVGTVTPKSAMYVGRYSLKTGVSGGKFVVNMSRRPGIGLDRIRQISRHIASRQPIIEAVPTWWRAFGRWLALDRTSREAFIEAYEGAGGLVKKKHPNPLRLDLDARIATILGDIGKDVSEPYKVELIERREAEHGSF